MYSTFEKGDFIIQIILVYPFNKISIQNGFISIFPFDYKLQNVAAAYYSSNLRWHIFWSMNYKTAQKTRRELQQNKGRFLIVYII